MQHKLKNINFFFISQIFNMFKEISKKILDKINIAAIEEYL